MLKNNLGFDIYRSKFDSQKETDKLSVKKRYSNSEVSQLFTDFLIT